MKKLTIYEPATCCAAGLCGVSVNTELLRISTVFDSLAKQGVDVKRFDLNGSPMEFISNKKINDLIQKDGVDILPITMLDDEIVLTKKYPTNEEIEKFVGVKPSGASNQNNNDSNEKGGCC